MTGKQKDDRLDGPRFGRTRALGAALAAIAVTITLAGSILDASPVAAAEGDRCAAPAVGCFPRMTFGLSAEGLPSTTAGMYALETSLGREAEIALTFTSFRYPVDGAGLRALSESGVTPMVTWEPFDATVPTDNRYPLRDITAGHHDVYLREQAARIREVGGTVALRFGHEMNASWYPWGVGVNGNTPADYVAAYRHVHDLFEAQDVRNVLWVWSPASLDTSAAPDLAPLYPGDAYVDWVALSAYLDQPTDTWANTVQPTVDQLNRVAPDRPIYLAETGVLPGATRPAMIDDVLGSLLRTPRAIGFTWFNIPSRVDWRIDRDPAALAAVRAALDSGWYPSPSGAGTAAPPPLVQTAPAVSAVPRVGSTVTATAGIWRGAGSTSGRWLVCADATTTSCTSADVAGPSLSPTPAMLGRTLRYEVVAVGAGGSTTSTSASSTPVVVVPATPTRPGVEARPGGARVSFPAAPFGTTHWRLALDGKAMQLVPVGTADYWLTALTNGTSHTLSLAAVAVSGTTALQSAVTAGTFTPMTQQYGPYLTVTGGTAEVTLPKPPVGAESWLLTVGGVTRTLPTTTTATSVAVPVGAPVPWTLVAAAGRWDGAAPGGTTVPSTGSFTPVATPASPTITPGPGSLTLAFPPAPAGATAWRVTVGPKTSPDIAVGTPSHTVTGLYPGHPATWTLRAVNVSARSLPLTGTAAAR